MFHHSLIQFRIVKMSLLIFLSPLILKGFKYKKYLKPENYIIKLHIFIIPVASHAIAGDIILPANPDIHKTINIR